jgi:hypothetical protein
MDYGLEGMHEKNKKNDWTKPRMNSSCSSICVVIVEVSQILIVISWCQLIIVANVEESQFLITASRRFVVCNPRSRTSETNKRTFS